MMMLIADINVVVDDDDVDSRYQRLLMLLADINDVDSRYQ